MYAVYMRDLSQEEIDAYLNTKHLDDKDLISFTKHSVIQTKKNLFLKRTNNEPHIESFTTVCYPYLEGYNIHFIKYFAHLKEIYTKISSLCFFKFSAQKICDMYKRCSKIHNNAVTKALSGFASQKGYSLLSYNNKYLVLKNDKKTITYDMNDEKVLVMLDKFKHNYDYFLSDEIDTNDFFSKKQKDKMFKICLNWDFPFLNWSNYIIMPC